MLKVKLFVNIPVVCVLLKIPALFITWLLIKVWLFVIDFDDKLIISPLLVNVSLFTNVFLFIIEAFDEFIIVLLFVTEPVVFIVNKPEFVKMLFVWVYEPEFVNKPFIPVKSILSEFVAFSSLLLNIFLVSIAPYSSFVKIL